VLKPRVLSLGIFSNSDAIDIAVEAINTLNGDGRSDVGIKVELLSQSDIE
jgi:hypothetical protein